MQIKQPAKKRQSFKTSIQGYWQWCYLKAKVYWVHWLESKTAGLSRMKLYGFFFVFLLFTSSYFTFLVIEGFLKTDSKIITVTTIEPVKTPIKNEGIPQAIITEKEYQKIQGFMMYLDSLKSSPTQKETYDSILMARPGLLDSIKVIESYYKSNRKMKENEK